MFYNLFRSFRIVLVRAVRNGKKNIPKNTDIKDILCRGEKTLKRKTLSWINCREFFFFETIRGPWEPCVVIKTNFKLS